MLDEAEKVPRATEVVLRLHLSTGFPLVISSFLLEEA